MADLWQSLFLSSTNSTLILKKARLSSIKKRYCSLLDFILCFSAIWAVALFAMGCFLLYTTYEQFTNYFKYPTITNTHVQTQTSVKFPAVTFCSASSLKRDSLPGDLYNLEYYLLTESVMGPFFPKLNFSNSEYSKYHVSLNESWVNNTANQVNDIFLFCFFEGKKKICDNAMKATVTKLGVCYTFNSREHVSENGDIFTSRTGSTSGLRLYLMVNQSNYVFSDAMTAGIKVLPSAVNLYQRARYASFIYISVII